MELTQSSYGICIKQCEILECELIFRERLNPGDLLQIAQTHKDLSSCVVTRYNFEKNTFDSKNFISVKQVLDTVTTPLWMYLIGTNENHVRMRIYNERELVLRLKCGDEITIKSFQNDLNANIKAVIQLIDVVQEVGVGNFVGLRILCPPKKHGTLVNLYKKHLNQSTSLLLFRIEQLLDSLKECEHEAINEIVKPEILPSALGGDRFEILVEQTKLKISMVQNDSNPFRGNHKTIKSTKKQFSSNETNRSTIISSIARSNQNSSAGTQPSLFDYVCNQNTTLCLSDWQFNSMMKDSCNLAPNNVGKENIRCAQLVDLSANDDGAAHKIEHRPQFHNNANNAAFDRSIEIPNQIVQKYPFRCYICSSQFHKMLTLKCMHNICVKCFGTDVADLIRTQHVKCPFKRSNGFVCKYELKNFELMELRQKLEASDLMPKNDSRILSTINRYNRMSNTILDHNGIQFYEEKIFIKCNTRNCYGTWFILKVDTRTIFRCPICQLYNCIKCNAIHRIQTCDEYKKAENI